MLILFVGSGLAGAQEGYPLDGTWRGQWLDQQGESQLVVMVLKWDGEAINAIINPGRNAFEFKTANLQPESWTVTIEANNTEGVPVSVTGVLKNIGSYHRTVEGNWREGEIEYPFVMRRE